MRRLVGALVLSLCLSFGLYGEVILTDEQATELEQTLDELEKTLGEQATLINDLKTQNSKLETQLETLKTQDEERTNLLEQQKTTLNEANDSYAKRETSWIMRLIATATSSLAVGLLIGLLL